MAYIDQARDPRRRATAILAVGTIHAIIAVGLVVGLTVTGFQEQDETITAIPLPDPVPTPTPEPEPPQPSDKLPPAALAPLPPLPLPPQPAPVPDVFDPADVGPLEPALPVLPQPSPTARVTPPPPLPTPTPSFTPRSASPRGNPGSWISTEDYPARPLRNGVEGLSGYRLVIGSDGRVSACEITASSGSSELDRETCRLITRRARFEPATNSSGGKVVGTYSGTVRWEIPD
jgi:periplasmic protein TonB